MALLKRAPDSLLQCAVSSIAIADAYGIINGRHEDLAVPNFSGPGRIGDYADDSLHLVIGDDQLQLDFRPHIHVVLSAPVGFGMSLLPAMTVYFRDSKTVHAGVPKGRLHFIQLEGLNDCFDLLHSFSRFLPGGFAEFDVGANRSGLGSGMARYGHC